MVSFREDRPDRLYPNLYGGVAYFYKEPNPRWTEILVGPRVKNIVAEWTAKVAASYVERVTPRSKSGELVNSVDTAVFIGGFKGDRWVGEITVGVEYAMADEFGRDGSDGQGAYDGSGDLRGALYAHLRPI